ncbi:MAG: bifunctional 4-hydroxy-2-oxoglutarate aldolase/2-dehydro-3-deoxy-phosphogluconate aldolase [Gemmatimonadaceae bacterium]
MHVLDRLRQLKIVPVIVINDPFNARQLADALVGGGLPCAEVTFRTVDAAEALRHMAEAQPDLLLGAGTVLTVQQARQARAAGAKFIVSPGFSPAVVDHCLEHQIPVYPGVCTPTEVEAALARGLSVLKFFPAEAMGGLSYLEAMSAPYTDVEFMPTGGIDSKKVVGYLAFRKVVACGGSWMAPAEWIRTKQFKRIRDETALAVAAVRLSGGER